MNDNSPFNVEAKGNGPPNIGHRSHGQFIEKRAHTFPQQTLAASFVPGSLKEKAGQLLGLVNSKGKPDAGKRSFVVFGQLDGKRYSERSVQPDSKGRVVLRVPHGLQNAFLVTNTRTATRIQPA